MTPTFFSSSAHFARWLETHHRSATEVWVGFYKKASAKRGISYPEAVDQALCYGWIDGVKKRVDADSYMHRFSPRTARSVWSTINMTRAQELKRLDLMQPAGLAAFDRRDPVRTGVYSFENAPQSFSPPLLRQFKANRKAWSFFEAQPPGYRRLATFWVMSAKRDETQQRRLTQLIEVSGQQRRLAALSGSARVSDRD